MNTKQIGYVKGIVAGVKALKMPERAAVIAVCVAITESGLKMYANGNNPASLRLPHDAVGWDHGSVGLFQQQVGGAPYSTANWGTVAELMNAKISGEKFLKALQRHSGWQKRTIWDAAQDVQVSAYDGNPRAANNWNGEYGGNYHRNTATATSIVNALWAATIASKPRKPATKATPWPSYMTPGNYFGLVTGPAHCHGGYYARERVDVKWIQQRLQALNYAPRTAGWADGIFGPPTAAAVARFQHAHMPHTQFFGQVWSDDWAKLAVL